MAMMFNCGQDWSFDMAMEDAAKAVALPLRHGVHRACESDGVALFTALKTSAKFFAEDFKARNNGRLYSKTEGYCGDAWISSGALDCVSDWYKDVYNQRPHFDSRVFAMLVGLPTGIDGIVGWCNGGDEGYLEGHARSARMYREQLQELAM